MCRWMGGRAHYNQPQLPFLFVVVSSQGEFHPQTGTGLHLHHEFPLLKHDQCDVQQRLLTRLAKSS